MRKKPKTLTPRRASRGDSAAKRKNERSLERAQRLVRKQVKKGTSLVDELIAERREAARNE